MKGLQKENKNLINMFIILKETYNKYCMTNVLKNINRLHHIPSSEAHSPENKNINEKLKFQLHASVR